MVKLVKEINATEGRKVKFIRCDNAGENLAFEKAGRLEGLGLTFEYTAPGTPQQNGKVWSENSRRSMVVCERC